MKKVSFVIAILVSAALAACHHNKPANSGGGSGDMAGSAMGSGEMGSGAGSAMAPAGSGM